MKKKYEKPEITSESISLKTLRAEGCCGDVNLISGWPVTCSCIKKNPSY